MTHDQIKAALDRVLTWPRPRQGQAIRLLSELEAQSIPGRRLTEEQAQEVRRRLAEPEPKFVTLEEIRQRFARKRA